MIDTDRVAAAITDDVSCYIPVQTWGVSLLIAYVLFGYITSNADVARM